MIQLNTRDCFGTKSAVCFFTRPTKRQFGLTESLYIQIKCLLQTLNQIIYSANNIIKEQEICLVLINIFIRVSPINIVILYNMLYD